MSPREMSTSSSRRRVTVIGGKASSSSPSNVSIAAIREVAAGRQDDHLVARAEHARRRPGRRSRGSRGARRHRADHPLHREARVEQVAVGRDVHVLEVVEQRRALVPGHVLASGRRRCRRSAREIGMNVMSWISSFAAKSVKSSTIRRRRLVVVDQVHLVDAHDEVRMRSSDAMNACRRDCSSDALARVDEHDREVGGRRAGDHVARVLHVAGRVGDDELAPRRREVAVGDVDRDALLALGAQAVGQQREVRRSRRRAAWSSLDLLELVLEDRLGVVEQAADQGGLAVVDGAGGREAEQLDVAADLAGGRLWPRRQK